jgi:predicted alpha/beta superfamily hydrolase
MARTGENLGTGPGDERSREPLVFPPVDIHYLNAPAIGQTFKISVMSPAYRRSERAMLPVVYATDANMMFETLRAAAYGLPQRFIVVGIGYPSDMPFAGTWLRARDMSFDGYPELGLAFPDIEGVLPTAPGQPTFYGGTLFRDFLGDILIPFIEEHYPVLADDRTYFGHSLGAGFGLYNLFSRPELFRRLILSSPGLIYNGSTPGGRSYEDYDFAIKMIAKFVASGRRLPSTRLYMSAGSEEDSEPGLQNWRITSSLERATAALRRANLDGLDLFSEILDGDTHGTAWLSAFIRGIRHVFPS